MTRRSERWMGGLGFILGLALVVSVVQVRALGAEESKSPQPKLLAEILSAEFQRVEALGGPTLFRAPR